MRGITFEEIDVAKNETLRQEVAQRSGRTTAPQVFIGEEAVGEYEAVKKLDEAGLLEERVFCE